MFYIKEAKDKLNFVSNLRIVTRDTINLITIIIVIILYNINIC